MHLEQGVLPIPDILTEMKRKMSFRLERPNLDSPEHIQALHRLNEDTAAVGQVSIDTGLPDPDSTETEKAWARGDLGYFRFVIQDSSVIGAVWSLADTHTVDATRALQEIGVDMTLYPEQSRHRELSSHIFDEVQNREDVDGDAVLLQLADEFGLSGEITTPLQTAAVYIDEADDIDRKVMHGLGFRVSADGVSYEGSEPCTVFVATPASVRSSIQDRASSIGINITSQNQSALK